MKKSFKDIENPALQFISKESIEKAERQDAENLTKPDIKTAQEVSAAPVGYKLNPLYIETKSERIQLLMQPTLKAKLKEKAARDGKSLNETIHAILTAAVAEE